MDHLIHEALHIAIVAGKNNVDFYRSAAARVDDGGVRRLFERLADEEAQHLDFFLELYPGPEFGDLQSLLSKPPHLTNPRHNALPADLSGSTGAREALELALEVEDICLDRYSVLVEAIRVPTVHTLFELALDKTLRRAAVLREEYLQFNKDGRLDIPRRLRVIGGRSHGNQECNAAAGQDFGAGGTSAGQRL
jgi:rubrerythrin